MIYFATILRNFLRLISVYIFTSIFSFGEIKIRETEIETGKERERKNVFQYRRLMEATTARNSFTRNFFKSSKSRKLSRSVTSKPRHRYQTPIGFIHHVSNKEETPSLLPNVEI